jgi:predicted RNA-binding Zn ribbon-like protein
VTATSYPGPLRHEPLAVELHNTVYALRGTIHDGLESPDGLRAWLAGIAERLPVSARGADPARHREFLDLRDAVRDALHASLEGHSAPAPALEALNAAAARAPLSPLVVTGADGRLHAETRHHDADPTDVALATIAADAVFLLTGPGREELRECRAPGCVLMFARDHPRRRWCSTTCGNRARQARHYARVRRERR